jgi:hypothetical protein
MVLFGWGVVHACWLAWRCASAGGSAFGVGFVAFACVWVVLVLVFSPFTLRFVRGHVILLFALVWACLLLGLCMAA